jgi:hypothetical protein
MRRLAPVRSQAPWRLPAPRHQTLHGAVAYGERRPVFSGIRRKPVS